MTLLELRTKLARYLQRSLAEFIDDGQDLLIEALESSRILAERTYSWNAQRDKVSVVVLPGGTDLRTLDVKIKKIESAWGTYQNEPFPLEVVTQKAHYQRSLRISKARNHSRYLSDADSLFVVPRSSRLKLVASGEKLFITPTQTQNISVDLDVQTWMETYRGAADDYTDWMIERGADYLFWQSLVEINHFTRAFVPRQEGNLPAPQRESDRALLTLYENDQHFTVGAYFNR